MKKQRDRSKHLTPTHGKTVVCEGGSFLILLIEFFFAADGVFHKIYCLGEKHKIHLRTEIAFMQLAAAFIQIDLK